jgi:hypothetical protein
MVRKQSKIALVLWSILLITSFTNFRVIPLMGTVALIAVVLPIKVDFFLKLTLAYAIYFSTNTILATVFYFSNLPVSSAAFSVIQIILLGIILFIKKITLHKPCIQRAFILKSVVSLLIVFTIAVPIIKSGLSVFGVVASGGDNISHIELIKAVDKEKGYYYKSPEETEKIMTKNLAGYPQGLHLNMFLLIDSLKPIIDVANRPKVLLSFYYVYTLSMFVLFGWLFVLLCQDGSDQIGIPISSALILFSGIFFSLFALGFQTQIASYVLFMVLLFVVEKIYSNKENNSDKKIYGVIAALMTVSIAFTWMFLLPVAGLITAFVMIDYFKILSPSSYKKMWRFNFTIILLGLLALVQPIVQLIYSNKDLVGVNEIGFTTTMPLLVVLTICCLSLIYFFVRKTKINRGTVASLLFSIFFSIIVYGYQIYKVGEPRYYYYKSIFTVLIIVGILLTRVLMEFISHQPKKSNQLYCTVLILVAGITIAFYNITNKNDYFSIHKSGGISDELTNTAIKNTLQNPELTRETIAVGSCNRAQDYTTTRLIGVLTLQNNYSRQALLAGMLEPKRTDLAASIENYQKSSSTDLIIYSTDKPTSDLLRDRLAGGREETYIDLDFGHIAKNKYSCPNAVK